MALTDALRSFRAPALWVRSSIVDYLERWHEAMLVCLPHPMRRMLGQRAPYLVLVPQGTKALLYRAQGREREFIGELDPQVQDALPAVLSGARHQRRRAVIQLPAAQVLTRRVSFPLQVRDNLGQVMRYEIDRLSPFQLDQVCFDFRLLEDSEPGGRISVELVLCRRDLVSEWVGRLREAGVPAERINWEGAWSKANLLPQDERPGRSGSPFSLARLLLMLVLLLLALALATPLWQKHQLARELRERQRELLTEAEKVHEVRGALERARQGSVAVLRLKWDQPQVIDLLRELTERLPDDTWVQNLDFKDGEVQLRGESVQATALIGLLEQAPGIGEVSFRSPVVQVARTGRDRYHISLKYERPDQP